ncbi:MAG: DUF3592 domain-containing protein [Acidobacteriaceae bacterium]|nr:DUF3592 domain-containing protein [Acidobacteriaceae bacterium]MBV9765900.1 DUF3592 domain-containing protein [Acidobacteriaceae bacterium]
MSKIADLIQQRFDRTWSYPSWWNLLIVLPWLLGTALVVHEWAVDRTIAQREKTADGTITTHQAANHDRYGYSFSINDRSYSGWQSPAKQDFRVGQQVTVFYDPLDPTRNALTDFSELEIGSIGPVPILLLGIGCVAVFIAYRRRRVQSPAQRSADKL